MFGEVIIKEGLLQVLQREKLDKFFYIVSERLAIPVNENMIMYMWSILCLVRNSYLHATGYMRRDKDRNTFFGLRDRFLAEMAGCPISSLAFRDFFEEKKEHLIKEKMFIICEKTVNIMNNFSVAIVESLNLIERDER